MAGSIPVSILVFGWVFCILSHSDPVLFTNAFVIVVVGVLGSYLIHEIGHWLALSVTSPDAEARWESTLLRISLIVRGSSSPRAIAVNAAAGPLACVALGALTLLIGGGLPSEARSTVRVIGWIYVAHAVFLIPPSTDGNTVLASLIHHR
ncbi:hypothetical protein [Cutibacterium acnes]|uniref:hypothetical protein n=1 Tax=Cutibacterium acnes TaxID=1747 RepID=UPI0022E2C5F2|nr:hypothetical protein [Cutibacterium acnes]